jgi:hypothetical protein
MVYPAPMVAQDFPERKELPQYVIGMAMTRHLMAVREA